MPWWLCRFFTTDVKAASQLALDLPTEERVERFGRPTLIEQFDSLPIEDFQQEFEGKFVDETYSFFPYELILPCTNDELVLYDEPTSVRTPEGRIVAGFDVGRTRDRSELAVFEEIEGRFHDHFGHIVVDTHLEPIEDPRSHDAPQWESTTPVVDQPVLD